MNRVRWLGSLIGSLVVLAACGAPASGPAAPARSSAEAPAANTGAAGGAGASAAPTAAGPLQALIDGARQEGQLTLIWGENTAGGEVGARRWAEGFNRAYGLNVDVRFTPGPSMPEVAAKVAQEAAAGRAASTDVLIGSEAHIASMMQTDTLTPVDWASWAPNIQDARLIAPGGVAVQLASRVIGITYNSNRISGSAVPTSLEDVLKPEYKGRIASTPYAANFDRLASPELWGEARTVDYVTKLADQAAGLMRCGEVNRILSGEFDMLVTDCGSYDALKAQAQGAPLGHAIPSDAAEIAYWYLGVPRNAAHPNAAKLWINYVLGREGQDILYELDFTDHHLIPGSKTAPAVEAQQAKGVKFAQIDVQFVQRNDEKELGRIRDQLQSILQKKR
ncbi:MAG TPA: ABC transporter substrate-binding protein [Chloroflexota bacterium]|nr:ABC transporter substrate-binding protein [Chloroflexota bacterium]